MAGFDPDRATAAWLARIPPAQAAAAQAYTDAELIAWFAVGAALLFVCWLVARSGLLTALRRQIEADHPRPWVTSAVLAGALALVLAAVHGLADGFGGWWADSHLAAFGGVRTSLAERLSAGAAGVLPAVAIAVLLAALLQGLMRRAPRAWPLVAGAAVTAVVLLAGWLPYALSLGPQLSPAPPGPARDAVLRLVVATGLPANQVLASPDRTFDADVTGGLGATRVVIGPDIRAGPPAEARAYLGHLMGHYAHADILVVCLVVAATMTASLFAAQAFAAPLARRLGRRPVAGPSDPEALPALAVILVLTLAATGLTASGYLRWANVRADAYSLDHAREPDGLAAVVEREWAHNALYPNPLETAIFYSHPPLPTRIRQAMAWKAALGG